MAFVLHKSIQEVAYFSRLIYNLPVMVVRMRHTSSHTKNRRSHHALRASNFAIDPVTGSKHLRHRVDIKTGMYKGRQVINTLKKVEKRQSKNKSNKK